jgi:hypothetical protein
MMNQSAAHKPTGAERFRDEQKYCLSRPAGALSFSLHFLLLFVRLSLLFDIYASWRHQLTRSPRFRVAPQKGDGLFHVLTGFDQQDTPIMASHSSPPEPSATPTEHPVAPSTTAESDPATPVNDEKHIPTSLVDDEKRHSIEKRSSLPHHASSEFPAEGPVLGAAGIVLESGEKANAAATAFKNHQSPPTHHEHGEKGQDVVAENGGAPTSTGTTTTEAELTQEESEADDEIVFPGTTQLAILTFGLCIATFTVALGESFS